MPLVRCGARQSATPGAGFGGSGIGGATSGRGSATSGRGRGAGRRGSMGRSSATAPGKGRASSAKKVGKKDETKPQPSKVKKKSPWAHGPKCTCLSCKQTTGDNGADYEKPEGDATPHFLHWTKTRVVTIRGKPVTVPYGDECYECFADRRTYFPKLSLTCLMEKREASKELDAYCINSRKKRLNRDGIGAVQMGQKRIEVSRRAHIVAKLVSACGPRSMVAWLRESWAWGRATGHQKGFCLPRRPSGGDPRRDLRLCPPPAAGPASSDCSLGVTRGARAVRTAAPFAQGFLRPRPARPRTPRRTMSVSASRSLVPPMEHTSKESDETDGRVVIVGSCGKHSIKGNPPRGGGFRPPCASAP